MRDQIAAMLDSLFEHGGADVEYTPFGGNGSVTLPCLVGNRDSVAEMGQADISHDVLRFEFRKADFENAGLSTPTRGATIAYETGTFTFSDPPKQDDLGLLWQFDAYR
jgi:hypothetical protein